MRNFVFDCIITLPGSIDFNYMLISSNLDIIIEVCVVQSNSIFLLPFKIFSDVCPLPTFVLFGRIQFSSEIFTSQLEQQRVHDQTKLLPRVQFSRTAEPPGYEPTL